MTDWNDAIALRLPTGQTIPARLAKLDLDGPGKGRIGVYLYGKQVLTANQLSQFERDDLGMTMELVDELTGKSKFGMVVNVPADLLDETLYDAKTGKMHRPTELECRRRIQEAVTNALAKVGGNTGDPITSIIVTAVRKSGAKDVAGTLPVS